MKRGQCPKCGSGKILHEVHILDRDGEYPDVGLTAEVQRTPEKLVFKGRVQTKLTAHICADCGYAELYAAEPDKLWQVRGA